MNRSSKTILWVAILAWMMLMSGCAPETGDKTATLSATNTLAPQQTLTPTLSPTRRPTATPTLPPLGNAGNPIRIGWIISRDDLAALDAADEIAFLIANATGFQVESLAYDDFKALSRAVLAGEIHLYWLEPLEYIYLNWEDAAQVMLLTNHLGVYSYGVQFMAHRSEGFQPYFDPATNLSTGDPNAALQQFAGTRPCFLNPDSLTGYYVPLGLLENSSTTTLSPVFAYDYSAIIRALYIQKICTFGVGYALIGDPRTASAVLQDLPDAREQVIVIWQSEGIIPNTNLSIAPLVPLHIRFDLQEAFLKLGNSQEGMEKIGSALDYDIAALKPVTDLFYNPLRDTILPLELDLEAIISKSSLP